jgi:L-alanine-DL-glutamate epimerase-like enolase superfamily enzyme
MTGLSAIDMALWDIEAKRSGVPLYSLPGGPIQNNLRVYFTHWDASIPAGKRDHAPYTKGNLSCQSGLAVCNRLAGAPAGRECYGES